MILLWDEVMACSVFMKEEITRVSEIDAYLI